MAQSIIDILIKLKDDTASGLNTVKAGLSSIESAANTVTGAIFNFKNTLAGAAVGFGFSQAVQEFAQFDDSMRAAGTIASATKEQYKQMSDLALKMGIDTKFKASEAAEAMVKLGYSSFTAADQLKSLPQILDMAAAGSIGIADGAMIAASMIKAFNMDASEAGRVADVVAKTFTNTATTMTELGEGWKYIAPIAAGLNVNFEELVGTLGILSNAGIKGSMGGTTLRQTIESLVNPSAEEAKLMKDLGDRIGGAGLIVKTSEGNFIGFASIIRQLEQAGMRADEALKLFGARGGPGMAALMAQGSEAIAAMKDKLDNAGGTAKKIATDMTAGLGGAITFLKSSIQSFFIGLGTGLDVPFKQFVYDITTDLNNLIYAINAAKEDGSLDKWMKICVDALRSFYDTMKSAAEWVWQLATSFQPLIESAIRLAPTIVEIGIAAAGIATAFGVWHTTTALATAGVGVFTSAVKLLSTTTGLTAASFNIGGASVAAWLAQVQRGSQSVGLLQAATYNLSTAISTMAAAGGALAVGYALGTLLNQIPAVQNAAQSFYKFLLDGWTGAADSQKKYTDDLKATQSEFAKFADMKFPADLTGKTAQELQELNKEVSGGIQYWTAYILELKAMKDQGQDVGNKLKEAEAKLAAFREESGKIKDAIKGYADGYKAELKAAEENHKNHVQLIKDLAEKQGKEVSDAMYKAIDIEAKAYKNGEISYEQLQTKKKELTTKGEAEISAIRLKAAEQIQKTESTQIAYTEKAGQQRIALIRQQVDAGVLTTAEGAKQIEAVEKETSERVKQIKTTTGQAVANEQKKINQEQVKSYLEGLKEEERIAKDAYKSKMDALKTAEDSGKISHSEAWKGRLEVEKDFLTKSITQAQANFDKAKAAYGVDSEQFKAALENKKKSLDDYYAKEKEIADKIKALDEEIRISKLSGEDKIRAIRQSGMTDVEAYNDKLRQFSEMMSQAAKLAETDQKAANDRIKDAQSLISGLTGGVGEYISKKAAAEIVEKGYQQTLDAQNGIFAKQRGELTATADAIKGIPQKLGVTLDTVNVKDGVAQVKTEMSQIAGQPVRIQVDPAALKVLEDQLKSVKQQAEVIQAKIDTAQPGPELDKLKERLAGVNTQAQSLQAKLDAAQPNAEMEKASAKAGEMQTKINTPSTLKIETSDAQGQVDKVGLSADDIQKKIEAGTTMKIDTSQPEKALSDVEKQTDAIDKEPVSVDVTVKETGAEETQNKIGAIPETKETAHTTVSTGTQEAIDALNSIPKEVKTEHKVVSTMSASSEKPTMEKLAEVGAGFDGLKKKVETPSKHKTSMEGDNGQGLSDFIAGKEAEYEDFKSKIEREKTTGRLTIEGEHGNLKSSLDFVSSSYGALFDELKKDTNVYSEEWAATMNKNAAAAKKMTDSVIKDAEATIADIAKSIEAAENEIKKLDEDIEKAAADYAKLGKEIADIDKQIAESSTKASEEIGKVAEETAKKISDITDATVTSVGEISIKTGATVRELNQRLMTDNQKYADNKIESERLVSEAKQALAQGDYELAKKLSEEAATVAQAMAEGANKNSKKAIEETQAMVKAAAEVAKQTETAIRDAKIKAAEEEAAAKVKAIEKAEAEKKAELELKKQELVAQQAAAKAQMEILAQQREASIAQKEIATQQLAAAEQTVDAVKQMAKQFETSFKNIMESFKSEMKSAMGEVKSDVESTMGDVKGSMEQPIECDIKTEKARMKMELLTEEMKKYQEEMHSLKRNEMLMDSELSRLDAHSGITAKSKEVFAKGEQQLTEKIKAIQTQMEKVKFEDKKVNVRFTGTASPEKPLTETLKDVSGSLESFFGKAEKGGKTNLSFGQLQNQLGTMGRNPAESYEFSKQMSNMLAGMGMLTGGSGGTGKPVMPAGAFPDMNMKDMGKLDLNIAGKTLPITGKTTVLDMVAKELPAMLRKTIRDEDFRGLI